MALASDLCSLCRADFNMVGQPFVFQYAHRGVLGDLFGVVGATLAFKNNGIFCDRDS